MPAPSNRFVPSSTQHSWHRKRAVLRGVDTTRSSFSPNRMISVKISGTRVGRARVGPREANSNRNVIQR